MYKLKSSFCDRNKKKMMKGSRVGVEGKRGKEGRGGESVRGGGEEFFVYEKHFNYGFHLIFLFFNYLQDLEGNRFN